MTISYNWLKEIIQTNLSPEKIAELLTAIGLEVEAIESYETIKGGLKGVVVGHVLTREKHPDADRLSVTTVDVGAEQPLNIVCGAPNVAAGQKVLVATVGSILYTTTGEKIEIKKSKIRGAASEGMICAEDELGLGQSHEGILVLPESTPVGKAAAELYDNYSDIIFEIGLTPNRADAASHLGVARDLYAAIKANKLEDAAVKMPVMQDLKIDNSNCSVKVSIADAALCPRYSGLVVKNIKVEESPKWLKNKLEAIGVRSINNIVDVTNCVLHELGQPMHAFDLGKIKGNQIVIKTVTEGTVFKTLDGVERKLAATDLMICDAEQPLCIAGVFGGLESGVSEATSALFLESAYFNPVSVRKTSKYHTLKTDSSFRFERGTNPNMTINALQRAAYLIKQVCPQAEVSTITDNYPSEVKDFNVAINPNKVRSVIGKNIADDVIIDIIASLGITIAAKNNEELNLIVPAYKVDVTREIDIIEEVLRIYGYNNIEFPEKLNTVSVNAVKPDKHKLYNTVADTLTANGFSEMMNNSLSSSAFNDKDKAVQILNPLSSELDVLRTSLLYGGLQTIAYNNNRKQTDLKLFEFGKTYTKEENSYKEQEFLSIFATGAIANENWKSKQIASDNYYIKSVAESVITKIGGSANYTIVEADADWAEQGIGVVIKNKTIATLGKLNKKLAKQFDLQQDVFVAIIDWQLLVELSKKNTIKFVELPRFPEVRRDLSLLLDKTINFEQLKTEAQQQEKKLLKQINLFDVYEGDKLPQGKKSYAISYMLQDEQATLTDVQIETVMNKIIKSYETKFGAELRK